MAQLSTLVAPPPGPWASAAARQRFSDAVAGVGTPPGDIAAIRDHYDRFNRDRLAVARRLFPVIVRDAVIGGVPVAVVTPADRAPGDRVLVCLHGGGFMWGAGAGALVEAVPVAAIAGCTVVAVDYRLAPEHRFPAAVDDAVACIRALQAERSVPSIGVFGCSAGGILTAQVVARLIAERSPLPGAVAMLHGTGLEVGGDSADMAAPLNGLPASDVRIQLEDLPCFEGVDPQDPLVFPGNHPDWLASFPASLLISGTRDFAASSLATMHRRLIAAGATSEFVLFDGMWHAHHVDTDLPEAREVFGLLARFFEWHLVDAR